MKNDPQININETKFIWFVIVFAITSWVIFYPGFMSSDSLMQYGMSKSLIFNDWHPPVMSWVWSVLSFFFPGPSGMLALHLGLLWASVYTWYRNYKERPLSWLLLVLPFLPWVLNFAGVLWKDVGMAFSLFMLSGLALCRPSLGKAVLALALAFYAINLRHNAIPAVAPIVVLLSWNWLSKPSWLKAVSSAIGLIVFSIIMGDFLNYSILQSVKTNPSNYMMIDDLVYLSVKNKESLLPGISLAELTSCAAEEIGQSKLVGKVFCLSKFSSYEQAVSLNAGLKKIWISQVVEHPFDYVRFRMAAFSYLLRTPDDQPYYIWHPGIDENTFGIKQMPNGLTKLTERFVKKSSESFPFLFKPYWWVLLSLLLLLATLVFSKSGTVRTAQAILISSVLYVVGYIPATPMADFRYIYWSIIAASLAVIILIVDWPGFRRNISHSRMFWVTGLAVFSIGLIYNFGKITSLNIDSIIDKSNLGERISIEIKPVINDLVKSNGYYLVKGSDPYLIFDLSSLHLEAQELGWVRFEFSCLRQDATPILQFFWWGDQQLGPSEAQSISITLTEGLNLIPIGKTNNFAPIRQLEGIRFDLSNSKACPVIKVANIELVK